MPNSVNCVLKSATAPLRYSSKPKPQPACFLQQESFVETLTGSVLPLTFGGKISEICFR